MISELHVAAYAGVPLQTSQGIVLGALCAIDLTSRIWTPDHLAVLTDFAAMVMNELELRSAIQRLREIEARQWEHIKLEAMGLLCSGVAHDVNNIVTMILVDLDVARDIPEVSPELLGLLQNIEEASLRAAKLTGQLLTFGRRHPVFKEPLLLSDFLREAQSPLHRLVRSDVELAQDETSTPLYVLADRDLLLQILVNLVVNANDAMPEKGGRILLSASRFQRERSDETETLGQSNPSASYVQIIVVDNGTGIPVADLPRVFEAFFTTKAVGQGTGLGLSSAYGIAEQHDGWLEVESEPGIKTTVRLVLPVFEPT